jgi:hypothetical protein
MLDHLVLSKVIPLTKQTIRHLDPPVRPPVALRRWNYVA